MTIKIMNLWFLVTTCFLASPIGAQTPNEIQNLLALLEKVPPCKSSDGPKTETGHLDSDPAYTYQLDCREGKNFGQVEIRKYGLSPMIFGGLKIDGKWADLFYFLNEKKVQFYRRTSPKALILVTEKNASPIQNGEAIHLENSGNSVLKKSFKNGLLHGVQIRISYQRRDFGFSYEDFRDGTLNGVWTTGPFIFANFQEGAPVPSLSSQSLSCWEPPQSNLPASTTLAEMLFQKNLLNKEIGPQLCKGQKDGEYKENRNNRVQKKWSCREGKLNGTVKYFGESGGVLISAFDFQDGVFQEKIHYVSGANQFRVQFSEKKIRQICSIDESIQQLKRHFQSEQDQLKKPSIWGATGALGNKDDFSLGLFKLWGGKSDNIGIAGWATEGEYLSNSRSKIFRLATGFGGSVFLYSFFAQLGLRSDFGSHNSVDGTFGLGIVLLNVYLRPIYDFQTRKSEWDVGLKFYIPLGSGRH